MRQPGSGWRRWSVGGLWLGLLAVAPLAAQEIGAPRLDPELPLCLQLPTLDPQVVEVLWGVNTVALASDRPGPVTVRPPLPGAPGAVRLPPASGSAQPGAVAVRGGPGGGPAGVAAGPLPAGGPGGVALLPPAPAGGPAGVTTAPPGGSELSWPVPAATQLLVLRLLAGDREPALLARLPAVPTADLLALLPGLARWRREDREAADLLALELLRRPTTPQDGPGDLPSAVALAIADALARQGEERCVGWYEGLLLRCRGQQQAPASEVLGLAAFYRQQGLHRLAAKTFLRHEQYSTSTEEMACCWVEAARSFGEAGDSEARAACLRRAGSSEYGWAAGVASIDQARTLLGAGRPKEAVDRLQRPAWGRWSERLDLGRQALLGMCYALIGRLDEARTTIGGALAARKASDMPPDWEGLDSFLTDATVIYQQLDSWQASPVRAEPAEVLVSTGTGLPLDVRLWVRTICPPRLRIELVGVRGTQATVLNGVSSAGWETALVVRVEELQQPGGQQAGIRIVQVGDLPGTAWVSLRSTEQRR